MKIAYMFQCHKWPEHINRLINSLDEKDISFFIHVDKKSNILDQIIKKDNIHFVDNENRIDVRWGQDSQIKATHSLVKLVIQSGIEPHYSILLSGQDYPIKSRAHIKEFLTKNQGRNFIDTSMGKLNKRNDLYYPEWMIKNKFVNKCFKKAYQIITGGSNHTFKCFKRKKKAYQESYYGSQWWAITYEALVYLHKELEKPNWIMDDCKNAICPDEYFCQTVFMNSRFKETVLPYLTYVDWSQNKRSPKVLVKEDFEKLLSSDKLFARKFDKESKELLELLDSTICTNE